ncbi:MULTISPECIES: reverse transcriptase domain-containing protein [Shewanella]|uniref:RNA-directed DNA polymerase n=1 Tax=Shewanella vaxholmensis TaxID=3063535 RepID=A0ABU9UQF4_9GAMM|nr:reverse transcriptase domain-containing protein [Shewanella sp. SP2S2-6]MDT3295436.1 reverse transcriptase domain-containing protein [Shewanella sp. SP2S2-6]
MKIKIINNEFFKNAILKGNTALLDNFQPSVIERKVGDDVFFEIQKNSDHHSINEKITKIVLSHIPINSSACGFVQGKSYFDFLKPHIHGYYFLRLDIKKFFHSIAFNEIQSLLKDCFSSDKEKSKYSPLDIAIMAVTHKVTETFLDEDLKGKDILPIGFSSSPVISNILFRRIDILIQKYCEDKKIIYSRYADDLLFSSSESKFLQGEQFEKEISIYISSLSLTLKSSKRKSCENTISLNGYVIQNTKKQSIEKQKTFSFLKIHKEDPVGTIRLSDKKIKIIKKLVSYLRKNKSATFIMENLFNLNFIKFKKEFADDKVFYRKFSQDQLQNKLKGYRSYLLSLIIFNNRNGCVDKNCLKKANEIIKELERKIL